MEKSVWLFLLVSIPIQQTFTLGFLFKVTPKEFFKAIEEEDVKKCSRYLKQNDADPNLQNDSISPLQLACRIGNQEICSLLLDNQADFKVVNDEGLTCLHEAARK